MPTSTWAELCATDQEALARPGYDAAWLADRPPLLQQTVLNLFHKLKAVGLWRFVIAESSSEVGNLEFLTDDPSGLRKLLRERSEFTSPGDGEAWSSRERRAAASLHLKHFAGWPEEKVQAHIDPAGVTGLVSAWRHFWDPDGYKDVVRIAALLRRQGL